MNKYSVEIEIGMKKFYDSLNEKDARRYAAIEVKKLGHGGLIYVSNVLNCDAKTILKGLKELGQNTFEEVVNIRKKGGGRKSCLEKIDKINEVFLDVMKNNTAGSPMNEGINWTNLTQKEIIQKMKEKNIDISVTVVKQLLKKHRFVKRKAQKKNL